MIFVPGPVLFNPRRKYGLTRTRYFALISGVFFCGMTIQLSGCGVLSEKQDRPAVATHPVEAHKIAIVNKSDKIVNTVEYKPCGADSHQYRTLTRMLRPNEKLAITIYSQCVDLMATNAFRNKLANAENIDLQTTRTWTIK